MSYDIPQHYQDQYTTNVEFLLQAEGGLLSDCVMVGSHKGEFASPVNQFGAVKAQRRTQRHADTPLISTPHARRWVQPSDYEWADLIDAQDVLRTLIDPQSAYTVNGVNAMRRAQDDQVLFGFFGDAKTGPKGAGTETFDTTTYNVAATVGAGASTGLNVAKLKRVRKIFRQAHVDLERDPIYMLLTAEEEEDLLTQTQVINMDYQTKPVLEDGRVTRFLGINFKYMEFTDEAFYDAAVNMSDGAGVNYNPAWARSGMHLGIWESLMVRVGERADKGYSTQVYVRGSYGATRLQQGKVIRVLNDTA